MGRRYQLGRQTAAQQSSTLLHFPEERWWGKKKKEQQWRKDGKGELEEEEEEKTLRELTSNQGILLLNLSVQRNTYMHTSPLSVA